MEIINKLKDIIFSGKENNNKNYLIKIIVMGLIGIIFLFSGNLFNTITPSERGVTETETRIEKRESVEKDYEEKMASRLEQLISHIDGVGKTRVQIITERSKRYEYEYNLSENNKITSETDQNDGERKIIEETIDKKVVIIRDSSGQEKPVIRVEYKPEITGVIIVAQGAEISSIRKKIYDSVSSFLDLPLFKINVLPHERS